jgi:hypothetical protein
MDVDIRYNNETHATLVDVEWEVWLNASIETTWEKMIGDVDGWWSHCYKQGSTVLIEQFPGGRFWERFSDGVNGSVYANVVYIEPPRLLKCVGSWAMPGVGMSSGRWLLEEQNGGTLVKANGQMIGMLDVMLMKDRKSGSIALINSLQSWVEQGQRVLRG